MDKACSDEASTSQAPLNSFQRLRLRIILNVRLQAFVLASEGTIVEISHWCALPNVSRTKGYKINE